MEKSKRIEKFYELAKEQYAEAGIDTDHVLEQMQKVPISLHCWQTDDCGGMEHEGSVLAGGGIQATGNFPGKARNIAEVRMDMEKVYSLLPGKHRLNLHASYGDFSRGWVDRDQIDATQFTSWADWAKEQGIGMDFNCTLYSHPKSESGFTLSSLDKGIRDFWIEHVKRCRDISSFFGEQLGTRCVHNIWIPDGSKDVTVNRFKHRALLKDSLDQIMAEPQNPKFMADAVEAKLFGIGLEAFTVGSHEFYLGYAVDKKMMLCLDIGHFHPTEQVSDKVSAVFQYIPELLFHVTRPIRWDSDHVVTLSDEVKMLFEEIVWADKLGKVNVGLDFFDGSLNRIGAYIVGTRAAQKAILNALLNPTDKIRFYEEKQMNFEKLALHEEAKTKPFGAVWDYFCYKNGVPAGDDYIAEIQQYEKEVLSKR
ncbi:MAG: L-rhamnose isomerase [Bacteroidales bacterium]|nr:L-rhamnose isomerase [Bacteroidales bacterium]